MSVSDSTVQAAIIGAGVTIVISFVSGFFAWRKWQVEKRKLDLEIEQLQAALKKPTDNRIDITEIRKGLETIGKRLLQQAFRPDIIVAFNRSGVAIAGMLAPNLQVDEIVSISRVPKEAGSRATVSKRTYAVGELIRLIPEKWRGKKILIVFMLMDTGNTIEDSLRHMTKEGVAYNEEVLQVATMYITSGAKNRWPNAIYAHEAMDRSILKRLPWIADDYDFV